MLSTMLSLFLRRRHTALALALFALATTSAAAADGDIVLYSTDVTTIHGNWARVASSAAAGGQLLPEW